MDTAQRTNSDTRLDFYDWCPGPAGGGHDLAMFLVEECPKCGYTLPSVPPRGGNMLGSAIILAGVVITLALVVWAAVKGAP